ncbi:MAG TPA: RluA family pseudouridine synthase [Polyangia bacterium]
MAGPSLLPVARPLSSPPLVTADAPLDLGEGADDGVDDDDGPASADLPVTDVDADLAEVTPAPAASSSGRTDIIHVRFRVPQECGGWRLDHFLKSRIQRLSRTKIQTIIAEQVRLEGDRVPRPAMGVRVGEVVTIERPIPPEPEVPRYFSVLHEEEHFLCIDKPAGLPMHTTAKFFRNTLTALLRERYPGQPLQLCHRLDRETSGVMLIARGPMAASFLKQAFAGRRIQKRYLALCHGRLEADEGLIDKPLKLVVPSRTGLLMGVAEDGARSVTRFRVVQRHPQHTLVEAAPETGRQHQIRVHLASIGHPIVGDKIYRASEAHFIAYCDSGLTPELLAAFDGLPRQALHAHQLTFPHPVTRAPVTVQSPLPTDLTAYIANLANLANLADDAGPIAAAQ